MNRIGINCLLLSSSDLGVSFHCPQLLNWEDYNTIHYWTKVLLPHNKEIETRLFRYLGYSARQWKG